MGNAASVSETRPPPQDCTFELEPVIPRPSACTVPAAIPAAGDAGAATTPQPLAGALTEDCLAFVLGSTDGELSGAAGHAQSVKGTSST